MERSYLVNYSFEKTKLLKMLQTPIRDYRVLLTNKKVKVFVKLKWVYLKQRNFQIKVFVQKGFYKYFRLVLIASPDDSSSWATMKTEK